MSTSSPGPALQQIISRTHHVLLDFDGPICSIFAGVTAAAVAEQLRCRLSATDVTMPDGIGSISDPLEVFRIIATGSSIDGELAQQELTTLEVQAVTSARATDGAAELISAARRSGRTVTIVSNNSSEAIAAYLHAQGLACYVNAVIGRDDPDPAHMKPNPYRVRQAIQLHQATPAQCALVGDSVSDVAAAHAAGVVIIGYANRPSKADPLAQAGADVIVARMADVIEHVSARTVKV